MLRNLDILNIDYSAANPQYRITETHLTKDLNGYYLIPFQGPIYARNLIVRADGRPLSIETHYTLEDDFEELELKTGKQVVGCIRFSPAIINNYTEIKIVYQKLGDFIASSRAVIAMTNDIINNDDVTTIDWVTGITNKPDTYPPAPHEHDVREVKEMVGFKDLVILFKQATGELGLSGTDLYSQLKALEERAFSTLDSYYKSMWDRIFTHIMNASVPHPMTKKDIGLGNHPNLATATIDEDAAVGFYDYDDMIDGKPAIRDDVLSTPAGIAKAVLNYEVDESEYMAQGSLPFSYYGTGFYLPPPITGSFEGLGTNTGGTALCIEYNNEVILLARGYDARENRLYYYRKKNAYDDNDPFVFTGHPYENQMMTDDGHEPNHAISGSSGRVLVIGDKEKNQYYVALGNGTLDGTSHQFKRIKMSSFDDDAVVGGTTWAAEHSHVMLIGDYIYIITTKDGWAPEIPFEEQYGKDTCRTVCFYRMNVGDFNDEDITDIVFKRQLMDYQNSEGEWLYGQTYVNIPKVVIDDLESEYKKKKPRIEGIWDGDDPEITYLLRRCVIEFIKSPSTISLGNPYAPQWFNCENPNNKNEAAIKYCHIVSWEFTSETVQINGDYPFCIPMVFNTETNTLKLDDKFFSIKRDFVTGEVEIPQGRSINEWYSPEIAKFTTRYAEQAACFIPRLGYATVGTTLGLPPYQYVFAFSGYNPTKDGYTPNASDWEIFNKTMVVLTQNGPVDKPITTDSSFDFSTNCILQRDVWNYNGLDNNSPIEIFQATNGLSETTVRYREVRDAYEYMSLDSYHFDYIDKKIIGRAPSDKKGIVKFGKYNDSVARKIAVVNTNLKGRFGVQYGMVNVISGNYNPNTGSHSVYGGLYYSDVAEYVQANSVNVRNNAANDLYISLLGKHTLDTKNKVLNVTKVPADSVVIPKEQWLGLVKTLLGDHFSIVSTEEGASSDNGEWILTMYISGQEGDEDHIIPSVALIDWHTFDRPGEVYSTFATFNWKRVSNLSTGELVIELINVTFHDEKHTPDTATPYTRSYCYDAGRKWKINDSYDELAAVPEIQIDFTDSATFSLWMTSGITHPALSGDDSTFLNLSLINGYATESYVSHSPMCTMATYSKQKLYVTDLGLTDPVPATVSGGTTLYVSGGSIPDDTYALLQAPFIGNNLAVSISADIKAFFNGRYKQLDKVTYDLSELGIDPFEKTFYLYAKTGKAKGYYELTLAERTCSPYQLLIATIKTDKYGIAKTIIEQPFAIAGFRITTENKGGSVPASSGMSPDTGTFNAIVLEDLVDPSPY